MKIQADNKNLKYMGRIDYENPGKPVFIWAGSNVRMKFRGTGVSICIKNKKFYGNNSVGVFIDGREYKISIDNCYDDTIINVDKNLDDDVHNVILFKRQGATHYFEFSGFEIVGEILECENLPERKIECFGDSVSEGEVCEALDYKGKTDPENHLNEYDNAWYSYSMITARNLNAQINNNAQGGIAIFDDTGFFHAPDCIGMESAYDKLCYYPEGKNGVTPWDFSAYIPDLVIFAIGQNDIHNEGRADSDIHNKEFREKWKKGYKKIILSLQEKYPDAHFILLLTVLQHDKGWDDAVREISEELDEKVFYFKFSGTGKVTPGHPRITEQLEMAEELTFYINALGIF